MKLAKKFFQLLAVILFTVFIVSPADGQCRWRDLRSDLTETTDLLPYLKSIEPKENRLKAWEKLIDFTHLRKDVDILASVSKILDNHPSFVQNHGEKLNSIIDKLGQAGAKCNSCPPNTQNLVKPYMKSIDQHLDDLEYMIANFGDKEGFTGTNSLINEMAASGLKADGGSFLMHYIKKNSSEFQNLTRFEYRFNDDLLNRADVLVGNVKYEMKSWSNGGSTWNAFFGGSGNSYQQFLSYLQNSNNLDNLKYVFNGAKATESQVKSAFSGLISNASKKQEIFDSMTSQLKQSLNIEFASDLTTSKIDDIINAIVRI